MAKPLYKFESLVNAGAPGQSSALLRFVTVARNMAQVETSVRKRMRVFYPNVMYIIRTTNNMGIYKRGDVLLRRDKAPIVATHGGQWIQERQGFFTANNIPDKEITKRRIMHNDNSVTIQKIWCTGRRKGGQCYDVTNPSEFIKI